MEKNTIGSRIKYVRKDELHITMDEMGQKIGLKKSTISLIESDKATATERMINDICREFNVNYDYLVNGNLPVFIESDDNVVTSLKEKYNLSDMTVAMIKAYLKCDENIRKQFEEMLEVEIEKMNQKK